MPNHPGPPEAASRRRVLVATNHLERISGSEVVALEAVEHFSAAGCDVSVFANWSGAPMQALVEHAAGRAVLTDPRGIRPFTYDIVYAQHQVLGLFDYGATADDVEATTIALGRLSRRSFMESGGWLHDQILGDIVLANSELTARHLRDVGFEGPVVSFHNGAPDAFFRDFEAKPTAPGRILVVSNHRDPTLLAAVEALRGHAVVEHVGRPGDRVERVSPKMIAGADLVISIGKTIPYALVGRVPVYVYDHFGGPGYLTPENRDRAALFNFTGRCTGRTLSSADLVEDILANYQTGVDFARDVPQDWLRRYRLAEHLDRLMLPPRVPNAVKRARMQESPFLVQERMLADYVRDTHRTIHAARAVRRDRKAVRKTETV